MKKVFDYLVIAAMAAMACTACSKDDDDKDGVDKSKNYVSYEGEEYAVKSLTVADYEDFYENGTYGYGIRLMLSGGDFVEVDILLANSKFPEGSKTYGYSDSHAAGTMDAFFYEIGEDGSESDGKLKSGSATISKTGDVLEISFNVTTPDGKTISGH
ncbi:MAG: hypothetical protein LBL24_01795, partial [Bacteroidales bacterium]|nr:hypothetical protein [Bacteroidales bacterium]